ncbi:7TM diverse intracellular signaling domain-containing protein [Runella rosea]|nr:7TM diverse intracellular signaling domain-containing protein [Runella rosea]
MRLLPFLLLLSLYTGRIFAQSVTPILVYKDANRYVETSAFATVLEDAKSEWSIQQVMGMPDSVFRRAQTSRLNLGNSESRFWVRFRIENKTEEDLYFLNVVPIIQYLELYVVNADGQVRSYPPSGILRPFENRTLPVHKINFHLGKNPKTLYFSVKSNRTLYFSNYIGTREVIDAYVSRDERIFLFCFGIYFILIIYNLVIYFYSRDKPFLWYSIFQLGSLYYFLYFSGLGFAYIWNDFLFMNKDSNIHVAASLIPACIFTMYFLNTRNLLPRFHVYLKALVIGYLGVLVVQLLGFVVFDNKLAQFFNFTTYLSLWVVAWVAYFKKHKTARFYLMGWTVYLFTVIMTVLFATNVIPAFASFSVDNYAINFGSIVEAIFLAFALADRVYEIRQQARSAQDLLLKQSADYELLVEKHNHLLNIQPNANTAENPIEVAQRLETLIQSIQTERDLIRKVSIPTIEGVILLPLSDIMYIEAMRSYAQFHLSNGKKIIASRPIGDFEDVLPDPTFFRIHKSHTVNLNYVERYIRGEGGSVILQNGSEIGVSRTAKAELLRRLQIS